MYGGMRLSMTRNYCCCTSEEGTLWFLQFSLDWAYAIIAEYGDVKYNLGVFCLTLSFIEYETIVADYPL